MGRCCSKPKVTDEPKVKDEPDEMQKVHIM